MVWFQNRYRVFMILMKFLNIEKKQYIHAVEIIFVIYCLRKMLTRSVSKSKKGAQKLTYIYGKGFSPSSFSMIISSQGAEECSFQLLLQQSSEMRHIEYYNSTALITVSQYVSKVPNTKNSVCEVPLLPHHALPTVLTRIPHQLLSSAFTTNTELCTSNTNPVSAERPWNLRPPTRRTSTALILVRQSSGIATLLWADIGANRILEIIDKVACAVKHHFVRGAWVRDLLVEAHVPATSIVAVERCTLPVALIGSSYWK